MPADLGRSRRRYRRHRRIGACPYCAVSHAKSPCPRRQDSHNRGRAQDTSFGATGDRRPRPRIRQRGSHTSQGSTHATSSEAPPYNRGAGADTPKIDAKYAPAARPPSATHFWGRGGEGIRRYLNAVLRTDEFGSRKPRCAAVRRSLLLSVLHAHRADDNREAWTAQHSSSVKDHREWTYPGNLR